MPAKLSTHVLDTANGCAAAGMKIDLWSRAEGKAKLLKSIQTNADGRPDGTLLNAEEIVPGEYELVFHVGDYFVGKAAAISGVRFLDIVPVRFGLADATAS